MGEKALRADYGLDAPDVVRNLALVTLAGALVFASAGAHLWSGTLRLGGHVAIELRWTALYTAIACGLMALWMVWSSKVGKLGDRDRLLDRHTWTGSERVLDVGCGRGLLLIGAAKRLTAGRAVGIDLWQAEDLSDNRAEATLENARREGVSERVRVETADMRGLPFADGAFDVIVSRAAIHNLYARGDRARALGEIARVLAPGGQVLIDDIRHLGEYEAELASRGLEVRRHGGVIGPFFLMLLTWGSLRPGTLVATKV